MLLRILCTAMSRRSSPASTVDAPMRAISIALLMLVAAAFLVSAWPRITGPFADSDDGINGAVWGYDSRGLRELGPLQSRLGGIRPDGTKYATHPPLIVVETAAIETVLGEHPWSTRAAAWMGSLVAIAMLFLLTRAIGLSPVAGACAVVAATASHMLFVYGAMLDTMITAFPFALALALVWYRQWTDQHEPRPWLVLLLAALTCLGGWQATFMVGLCGVATLARWRSTPGSVRRALPYLVGVAIGVVVTLAWAYWVYGSFEVLNDKLLRRTGGTEAVSLGDMIAFQIPWLDQLLGLGFLAWIACAVSLRDKRFRPLASLALVSVIAYAVILKEGSGGHQYWNYWGLFPAAIGFAYVFDALSRFFEERAGKRSMVPTVVLVSLALLIAAINWSRPDQAAEFIADGVRPYRVVADTPFPPDQTELPYLAEPYRIDDWLRYAGGPRGTPILDAAQLRSLAAEHPDHVVLVLGSCAVPDPTEVCERLTWPQVTLGSDTHAYVPPRMETAASLAARLG